MSHPQSNASLSSFKRALDTAASASWLVTLLIAFLVTPVNAAVYNVAQTFDLIDNANDGDPFDYGYHFSGNQPAQNDNYILENLHQGFRPYGHIGGGNPGSEAWLSLDPPYGFGFPYTGVLSVPPSQMFFPETSPLEGGGGGAGGPQMDWPSAEGDMPDYPYGVIGGHNPNCAACTGWAAIRWTAPEAGPVDLVAKIWQSGTYPEVSHGGANNPPFGGNTRPQQMSVQRSSSSAANSDDYTLLHRSAMVPRHGWTNTNGTPHYTAEFAESPGDPATFLTNGDERDAALASSLRPNTIRLTNLQLNAGDSLDVSLAGYFGDNNSGFHVYDVQVFTGEDRAATQSWDLARDYSAHGDSATGIGPDEVWSYGKMAGGNFAAYDKIMWGQVGDDDFLPRENHGHGTNGPGWFDSSAEEPETGLVTPSLIKDYDGRNITRSAASDGWDSSTDVHLGDWGGGKVSLHTPASDEKTTAIRWTAPEAMTVDVDGSLWPTFLDAHNGGGSRGHEFELVKNGSTSLASGSIDSLSFDCNSGVNSTCGTPLDLDGISVGQGDTLDLLIRPQNGNTETFITTDFTVTRAAAPAGATGDYNDDGIVDAADYTVYKDAEGTSVVLANDMVGGTIGAAHYAQWASNFGQSLSGSSSSAVPEPTSLVLLAASLAGLFTFGRQRFGR